MWEFDDNRAIPTNLVLEQDFILRIRRLQRIGSAHHVANILLSEIPADYHKRGKLEDAQNRLQSLILAQKGIYTAMSSGDVFLIWPKDSFSDTFPHQALETVLPDGFTPEDLEKYVIPYRIPEDYNALRECASAYVEKIKTSSHEEKDDDENAATRLLQSDAARGPLTAWSVNQIEQLAKGIDLCSFIRSQPIYELRPDKSWKPILDESFMGLEEIKQTYFPHIDITQPKHLFLDLCRVLDRSLLTILTQNYDSISELDLNLNLSIPTVLGIEFAQFTHRIPRAARQKIGFEIHCGDLTQDFTQTLSALATLRQEGFKIALDGITPDMMGYINFSRFDVDYIKINVSKERTIMLKHEAIRNAITAEPLEKIIFSHCDSEQSLEAGIEMGITKFQGWLLDEKAHTWRKGG